MQIPLNLDKNSRVHRPFKPVTARNIMYEALQVSLTNRLTAKIKSYDELITIQMINEGTYDPAKWRIIERLDLEIERLKGAVAVMRWINGQSEAIDLGMPGYLDLGITLSSFALPLVAEHE